MEILEGLSGILKKKPQLSARLSSLRVPHAGACLAFGRGPKTFEKAQETRHTEELYNHIILEIFHLFWPFTQAKQTKLKRPEGAYEACFA